MGLIDHNLYIERLGAFIDPPRAVEKAIITHAHADHAKPGHKHVLATQQTIDIMKIRYGNNCAKVFQAIKFNEKLNINDLSLTFFPAGHILGSAQVLITDQSSRYLITGDYKTKEDSSCQTFQLVECDVLITEATFGLPVFQHPNPKKEIQKLLNHLKGEKSNTYIIGAYSLGKAQRVIRLLREAGFDENIYLHGSQSKICEYYETQGINLGELSSVAHRKGDEFKGKIVIAPPSALRDRWSRRFSNPVICAASGWMSIKQRAKQSLVEIPLVISDHADWNELTDTILETGSKTVWVTHGREEALVYWCKKNNIEGAPLNLQGREEDTE
tara:strand:- start:88 stop:1074 length:987 start_codon:yes stop_codon:yes gene_type:complete